MQQPGPQVRPGSRFAGWLRDRHDEACRAAFLRPTVLRWARRTKVKWPDLLLE